MFTGSRKHLCGLKTNHTEGWREGERKEGREGDKGGAREGDGKKKGRKHNYVTVNVGHQRLTLF